MLKIFTVMLTTAVFATLLIVEPFGSRRVVSIGGPATVDPMLMRSVPVLRVLDQADRPVAGPNMTAGGQVVLPEPLPVSGQSIGAANDTRAGDTSGIRQQAAPEGYWAQATANGTTFTYRRLPRSVRTERNPNAVHSGSRRRAAA
jgi:hypothetical protein